MVLSHYRQYHNFYLHSLFKRYYRLPMMLFKIALRYLPRPLLIRLSYVARPFLMFFLRGNVYTDPIDGRRFRTFLPYGYRTQRPNVLSPSTFSLERHRLLWLYLLRETDFFTARLRVLHVAPEQAFYKRFKALKNVTYITTDLQSPLADVKADITQLPFATGEFDVILCNHVLEHIEDDIQAMEELYRVMKPGGWGIFQVPVDTMRAVTFEDATVTSREERMRLFGQYDHVRIYGWDFFDRLQSVGFRVNAVSYVQKLHPSWLEKYRLSATDILPVCYKAKEEDAD